MRNTPSFFLLLAIITICFGFTESAQSQQIENTAFRFLNLPTSARTAALGGAHISLNDAGIALFQQNPAYLNPDQHRQFALSYINHLSDVNIGFFNGAYEIKPFGTAAIGIRYVNYGEIDKKDEFGNKLGTFNANDLSVSFGFGRFESEYLRYGGSVELIYSGYDIYQATGIGLDLGVLYTRPDQQFTLGASVNNAGYQTSTYRDHRESLPLNMSIAASKRIEHTPLRISLMGTKLNQWPRLIPAEQRSPGITEDIMRHLVIGGEFIISSNVFFRLGYNYYKHQQLKTNERLDLAGVSYGIGITVQNIQFDFSRSSYSGIGGLTQLSIQTSL